MASFHEYTEGLNSGILVNDSGQVLYGETEDCCCDEDFDDCECCNGIFCTNEFAYLELAGVNGFGDECEDSCDDLGGNDAGAFFGRCYKLTRIDTCKWRTIGLPFTPPNPSCFPAFQIEMEFSCDLEAGTFTVTITVQIKPGEQWVYQTTVNTIFDCSGFSFPFVPFRAELSTGVETCNPNGSDFQVGMTAFGECGCEFCATQYQINLMDIGLSDLLCDDATCDDVNGSYVLDFVGFHNPTTACATEPGNYCHWQYEWDPPLACVTPDTRRGFCSVNLFIRAIPGGNSTDCTQEWDIIVELWADEEVLGAAACDSVTTRIGWKRATHFFGECATATMTLDVPCIPGQALCDFTNSKAQVIALAA